MIAWAIETARQSNLFDHILVSTDNDEICQIAGDWGAEVPFKRPEELADDITPTVRVIAHAVREVNANGWGVEYACCIYPCSPLMCSEDLKKSFELMVARNANFVYPVTEYPHPIQRAMRRLPDDKMKFYSPQYELARTQDLETSYHDAGQFYWGTASAWLEEKKMHTDGIGMVVPKWKVVDIDTEADWIRATHIHKAISECNQR